MSRRVFENEECVHRMSLLDRTVVRDGWPSGGKICRGERGGRWIEWSSGERRELPSDWSWWWNESNWSLWDQQRSE